MLSVGVLGWDDTEPESVGLVKRGLDRGHDTILFTLDDVVCDEGPEPRVLGGPVSRFDVILCRPEIRPDRIQPDYERYALLCDVAGVRVIDPCDAYFRVENKVLALRALARAGLPIVPTVTCRSLADVLQAAERWDGAVVKPTFGYGGTDVTRVVGAPGEREQVGALLARYGVLICQPFAPHPDGDFRITVVGDGTPLNFQRVPAAGDWRANTMQGATVRNAVAPDELCRTAVRAARVMGITVAGLDFVPTGTGHRILEINNTPGWYLSEPASQLRVLDAIYDEVESRVGP